MERVKPILFNTEMVRAILDGRKTQTRRVCKGQGECNPVQVGYHPPFKPGDILWVRETWHKDAGRYMYRANYIEDEKFYRNGQEVTLRWHPSIHMPKEAARIFLRVKDVRVERLQNITCADITSEGVDDIEPCEGSEMLCNFCPLDDSQKGVHNYGNGPVMCEGAHCEEAHEAWVENYIDSFADLWDSTIKPSDRDVYGWDANPWVWVIEFERCEKPEGWCGCGEG